MHGNMKVKITVPVYGTYESWIPCSAHSFPLIFYDFRSFR